MAAGATPPADGSALLLSMRRMNRIRSISAENRLAVAEAGVILATLHDAAHESGMRFPLTLGARGSCTIGGLTSTNAGGTQVLKFGTMRVASRGRRSGAARRLGPQRPVGPQEGQSRLQPRPAADRRGGNARRRSPPSRCGWCRRSRRARSPGPGSKARRTRSSCCASSRRGPASVEGFELVPQDSLELVLKHIPGTRAAARGQAPLARAGRGDDRRSRQATSAAELERLLGAALQQGIIGDAVIASNEAQAEAFWKLRDTISEAERAEGQTLAHDISVPVADMPRFIIDAAAKVEARLPGRDRQRLRPPRRRQHPLPRPRRQPRRARLVRERRRRRSRAWSTIW